MLTIKAVYAPNQEEIFEAKRIRTLPISAGSSPDQESSVVRQFISESSKSPTNVYFEPADSVIEMCISNMGAEIYVMNDKGRTIAHY